LAGLPLRVVALLEDFLSLCSPQCSFTSVDGKTPACGSSKSFQLSSAHASRSASIPAGILASRLSRNALYLRFAPATLRWLQLYLSAA